MGRSVFWKDWKEEVSFLIDLAANIITTLHNLI